MLQWWLVAAGGAVGAVARYAVAIALTGHTSGFPWATLLVNVLGSFLIGVLATWLLSRGTPADVLRWLLLVGFLGAFTTFSSFSLDTLTLLQQGEWLRALLNIIGNLGLCLLAVFAGAGLARLPLAH